MKKVLLIILAGFTNYGWCGAWVGPYTIEKVQYYDIGGTKRLDIHVKEVVAVGCSFNDSNKMFRNYSYSTIDPQFSSYALATQAQERKVLLYVSGSCENGNGLSLQGFGVEPN